MRFPSIEMLFLLVLAVAMSQFLPARAEGGNVFSRGDTLHLGDVAVRLDGEQNRWGSIRQGNIDLDKNTFLFGREDTYQSMSTRNGIDVPETGATIGVGMGFTF